MNFLLNSKTLVLGMIVFGLLFSFNAQAQGGLVPCSLTGKGLPKCEPCHIFELIARIMTWLQTAVIILSAGAIAYGGLLILTAGDSSEQVENGKKAIKAAVIGIVIALVAWLVVRQLLSILDGNPDSTFAWDEITCTSNND